MLSLSFVLQNQSIICTSSALVHATYPANAILKFFLVLLWRYSLTWALASSVLLLQASISFAYLLRFLHFNILLAFLSTASIHLPLGNLLKILV